MFVPTQMIDELDLEYAHFATQQGWKNDKETDITEDGKDRTQSPASFLVHPLVGTL